MAESQWIFHKLLPERLHGNITLSLPDSTKIRIRRKHAIVAGLFQIFFSILCLPLAALRRGLSIFMTALNVIFIFASLIGVYGSVRLNYVCVLFHGLLILALCGFLLLYVVLVAALTRSSNTQTLLIVIILVISLVDIACASLATLLGYTLYKFSQDSDGVVAQATIESDIDFLERVDNAFPSCAASNEDKNGDVEARRDSNRRRVIPSDQSAPQETPQGNNDATHSIDDVSSLPSVQDDFLLAKAISEMDLGNQNESRGLSQRSECKICFENAINAVLLPCGHMVACLSCSRKLSQCPICRKRISKAQQVYTT